MAQQYVVTISRQFGSMGRSIARRLSEILEIEYLDRDIVEATAKRMGLPVSVISEEEENSRSGAGFFRRMYPLGIGVPNLKDEIFDVQKNIIRDFASKDSCIIVGRCAEGILSDFDNRLSVYIYATFEARIKNCTDILQMDLKTARGMIKEVDAARENYHRTYCPGYTSPFDYRDIMLDSGRFGIEGTAGIIAEIVRKRWCQ